MRKKIILWFDRAARLYFLVSLILLLFFGVVLQDRLLFKTDPPTLLFFFAGTAFMLWGVFVLPLLVLRLASSCAQRGKWQRGYGRAVIFLLAYGFLATVFSQPFLIPVKSAFSFAVVHGLAALLALGAALLTFRSDLLKRIHLVARLVFAGAILYFILFRLLPLRWQSVSDSGTLPGPRKNLVLFVMDGLGAEMFREYRLAAPVSLAGLGRSRRLFLNVRTNFTYTYDYFATLFYGTKSGMKSPNEGLLRLLEKNRIHVRWLASHTSAVPDSHGISGYKPVSGYQGLRSFLLNWHLTWLPRLLGIDYHIYYTPRERDSWAVVALQRIIASLLGREGDFSANVADEINVLRRDPRSFFFLIHVFPACASVSQRKLWDDVAGQGARADTERRIREHDYYYDRADEWLVEEWRWGYGESVKAGLRCLEEVCAMLVRRGWDRDTTVLVTADHGTLYGRGKVWYGYHADEEVTRVPLVMVGAGWRGSDSRLAETIDLTRTILDYFTIPARLAPAAVSLLEADRQKPVTTLTLFSPFRQERFFNLYKSTPTGVLKYRFNLMPPGEIREYDLVDGWESAGDLITGDTALQKERECTLSEYVNPQH